MNKRGVLSCCAAAGLLFALTALTFAGPGRDTAAAAMAPGFNLATRDPAAGRFVVSQSPLAASRLAAPEGVGAAKGLMTRTSPFSLSIPGPGAPPPRPVLTRHPGRRWLELGAFMAYSGISYWIKYTKKGFIEDWQFQLDWHDQSRRFFTLMAWRFDSNNFMLNWTHSVAGGIYYQFARTSNLSWEASLLTGVASSFFWEYVIEWKEVVSINDQIMTGLGSYATGEPFYQIGDYFLHQPNFALKALGLLNPVNAFNHWLDRREAASIPYEQPGWHDFGLFAGTRRLTKGGQDAETTAYFGVHTRLLAPPDYGIPGEVHERLKDTYYAEISLDYAYRNGHADETNFWTRAVTLGSFRQSIDAQGEGHSLLFGLGSWFEYYKKRPIDVYDYAPVAVNQGIDLHLERPRAFTDKLADLHIAGPVLDWTLFRRGFKLRTVAEAYVDFALVNSLALNPYSALHNIDGMKTTVLYYGYYYGFGGTAAVRSDLEWGNFRARALGSFGAWTSADFRDRFQDQVTNNAHLGDNRTRWLAGVGWKVPHAPFEFFLDFEELHRWGKLREVTATFLEKRLYAGLEFTF